MLFNFQSPVSFVHSLEVNSFIISRGFEFVKHFFRKSFKFFVLLSATKKHSIFSLPWGLLTSCDVLSRWQLIYNIMPKLFCQHLFSKKYNFFEKKEENPSFSPLLCPFLLLNFCKNPPIQAGIGGFLLILSKFIFESLPIFFRFAVPIPPNLFFRLIPEPNKTEQTALPFEWESFPEYNIPLRIESLLFPTPPNSFSFLSFQTQPRRLPQSIKSISSISVPSVRSPFLLSEYDCQFVCVYPSKNKISFDG